jgi:endonuclease III
LSRVFEVRFVTDREKAVSIARRLYDEFYNRKGFFEGYEMPEYVLPANLVKGSKEHAWYLTFVISIDYMTDAVKLWRNAREAYRWYPERFNPTMIVELGDKTLTSFVRSLGARYPRVGAETWKKISTVLLAQYNGDPRNITSIPLTIQQVKAKLRAFPYLRGNKLSNFYLRAMGENNLLKISNFDELDIPVDIQVARFTVYTGVLRLVSDSFEGCIHKEPLKNLIEEVWRDAAREIGTYPWKLDEPIWTIGSKLCAGKLCGKCPVEDVCAKVKGIKFKGAILIWEKPSA